MTKYYKTKETAIRHLEAGMNFNRVAFNLIREDRDVAFAAVKKCHTVFNSLSDNLRNDIEIAIQACSDSHVNYECLNLIARLDRRLIMITLKHYKEMGVAWHANTGIHYLPFDYEDDEMMDLALNSNGKVFSRCSKKVRSDPVAVMNAIKYYGKNIVYASDQINNDKEIILSLVKINPTVYFHLIQEMKDDKEVALEAIKMNINLIKNLSEILLGDLEFMSSILKYSPDVYHLASYDVRTNCEFAYEALHIHKEKITDLPNYISDEIDIARYLVENITDGYVQVSKDLRCDQEILTRMWISKAKKTSLTYRSLPTSVLLEMKGVGLDVDNLMEKYDPDFIGEVMDKHYRKLRYDKLFPEKKESDKQIKI